MKEEGWLGPISSANPGHVSHCSRTHSPLTLTTMGTPETRGIQGEEQGRWRLWWWKDKRALERLDRPLSPSLAANPSHCRRGSVSLKRRRGRTLQHIIRDVKIPLPLKEIVNPCSTAEMWRTSLNSFEAESEDKIFINYHKREKGRMVTMVLITPR
jgi:hypothetical protein